MALGAVLGAMAPYLASAGGGLLQGLINKDAGGGQMGYDFPTMAPSEWDYDNQRLSATMAQNMAQNAQAGRLAPGVEIMLEKIRKHQLQMAQDQMYGQGLQGGGGIMGNVMAAGAMSGAGPKAVNAKVSRALNDYASRTSQIQNYIDTLKFSGLQGAQQGAITAMQTLPRSKEIPFQGAALPYNNPGEQPMDLGLQNIDYSKLFSNAWGGGAGGGQYGNISPTVIKMNSLLAGNTPSGPGEIRGYNYDNINYPVAI